MAGRSGDGRSGDERAPVMSFTGADIRGANTLRVFNLLRSSPSTRSELVTSSGLARPTVDAIVRDLLKDELLVQRRRPSGAAGGRPSSELAVRSDAVTVATIRFSAAGIEAVLADLNGSLLARAEVDRPDPHVGPDHTLDALALAVTQVLDAAHVGRSALGAVSLTLPGRVDGQGCWTPPGPPSTTPVDVIGPLSESFGIPVTVANVAAASLVGATLKEDRAGPAVLLYVGRGIGSALAIDGRPVIGWSGAVGEIGHVPVPGNDRQCVCGRTGCLQTLTSTAYLREEFARRTESPEPGSLLDIETSDSIDARILLGEVAQRLASVLTTVVNFVNPSVVHIAGPPFVDGSSRLVELIAAEVRRTAYEPNTRTLRIQPAPAGAVVTGGVRIALERLPAPLGPPVTG